MVRIHFPPAESPSRTWLLGPSLLRGGSPIGGPARRACIRERLIRNGENRRSVVVLEGALHGAATFLARIFEAVACHLSGGDAARHFRFHALVYRSEPVAIVKEGLPARVIGMTRGGATSPIALAMQDLAEITKLSFWGRGVKMCRSGGV
jgi:hypothetical protein